MKRYTTYNIDNNTESNRGEPFISFSDFCKQPKVRFLSQIHRIEAYMWFLFQATEQEHRFRVFLQGSGIVLEIPSRAEETDAPPIEAPFGWPLASAFELGRAPHVNVHNAASPGNVLRCPPKASYGKDSPLSVPQLPDAQYIDPGKGDAVTQMQDIFQHRALAGSELHWEDLYRTWETGLEGVTNEVLEHVLMHSPCRLSVLLSLSEDQIVNLSLSQAAIEKIGEDFNNCKELLR